MQKLKGKSDLKVPPPWRVCPERCEGGKGWVLGKARITTDPPFGGELNEAKSAPVIDISIRRCCFLFRAREFLYKMKTAKRFPTIYF